MVSAQDRAVRFTCAGLCSWAGHLHVTLTVPLSTQDYKWVLSGELSGQPDKMLGVTCDEPSTAILLVAPA